MGVNSKMWRKKKKNSTLVKLTQAGWLITILGNCWTKRSLKIFAYFVRCVFYSCYSYTYRSRLTYWGAVKGRALGPPWWTKLSPLELVSTQMRLRSDLQRRTFIASNGFCQGGWEVQTLLWNAQSPTQPPVWRDKGKRFKGYPPPYVL